MTNQLPKLGFTTEIDHRLSTWYLRLSPEDLARCQSHFKFLGSLLQVKTGSHMLESLVAFWDPTVIVFRFGEIHPDFRGVRWSAQIDSCQRSSTAKF